MPINFAQPPIYPLTFGFCSAMVTARTTTALNSAYSYNSAGAAVCMHFCAPESGNLTDVYVFCSALAGTASNIVIGVELRNRTAVPGTTLHASQTASATTTANKWTRITFSSPYSVTKGQHYSLVVYNASSSPTVDYPTVVSGAATLRDDATLLMARTTTNGWTEATSLTTAPPFVAKIGSRVFGFPYTSALTNSASSTNERGLKLVTPFSSPVTMVGLRYESQGNLAATGLKFLLNATAPGSTPGTGEAAVAFPSGMVNFDGILFSDFQLAASTTYRIVFAPYVASNTRPRYVEIGDYSAFADVQAAAYVAGNAYYTEQSGSSWVDYPERFPVMQLLFSTVDSGGASVASPAVLSRNRLAHFEIGA